MTKLQREYQLLVDQGLLNPAEQAPHFEPLYVVPIQESRIVYNIGEALIREEVARSKLGASSSGDTVDGRTPKERRRRFD